MAVGNVKSYVTRQARFRLCNVSGYMTELLEIQADNPDFHVLFIPGNPGIVNFYKGFLESLYELLEGNASVTAIGHLSQTSKMDFIDYKLHNKEVPIVLVGHSIGSYISIEIFKRYPRKVIYCTGLYPFLALNAESSKQIAIKKLADSRVLSLTASLVLSLIGLLLPIPALRFIVKKSFGNSWSADAVDTACSHLVLYHIIQNMLFMARTEFKKRLTSLSYFSTWPINNSDLAFTSDNLSETPDWEFMRAKKDQIAFLFGSDDHWGPLSMFEEISKQVHGVDMSIEREGYDHAFSCTEAGSLWVARHVACLINKHVITTT